MEKTPPPENISSINITQNIPDSNTISINDLANKSPLLKNYYENVVATLNSYKATTNNHYIIPAILAFPQYALQSQGYLGSKETINIKVKVGRKYKKYIINVDNNKEKEVQKSRTINDTIAKTISYDITDLPVLAELLANAAVLNKESVDQRLKWLQSNEIDLKVPAKMYQQTSLEGQISYLVLDFAVYWEKDQTVGWQKIIRSFLLGFEMRSYYENKLSKALKKGQKKADQSSELNFTKENTRISSKCIKELMQNKEIKDIIDRTVLRLNNELSGEEDYNYVKAHEDLSSKIRNNMKFSYILYHFVLMFGYIALISPPTTGQSELSKFLKLPDLEMLFEKFNYLKKSSLGKDIIKANNKYGTKILNTVLQCSENLKINNQKLRNGLEMINTQYLFISENANGYKRGVSDKKQRLARVSDAYTNDSESVVSLSVNSENSFTGSKRKRNVAEWRDKYVEEKNKHKILKERKNRYDNNLLNIGKQINDLSSRVSKRRNIENTPKINYKKSRVDYSSEENHEDQLREDYSGLKQNSKRRNTEYTPKINYKKSRVDYSSEEDQLREDRNNSKDINYFPGGNAVANKYNTVFPEYNFDLERKDRKELNPNIKMDVQSNLDLVYQGLSESSKELVEKLAMDNYVSMGSSSYTADEDKKLISNYGALKSFIKEREFIIIDDKQREKYQSAITNFVESISKSETKTRIYFNEVENQKKSINDVDELRSSDDINLICGDRAIEICQNDKPEFYESDDMENDTMLISDETEE